MSDQFDSVSERLHQFDPGEPVNAPTAAEIRRRGDRMRRRNTTLAAVGTVIAVAVIATPISVLAGGGGADKREVGPATDPPSSSTPTETATGPLENTDLVTVDDLPVLPEGFEPWTEQPRMKGVVLTCQPAPTEAVGATESKSREYTTYITPGEANVSGSTEPTRRVRTAVLRFDDTDAARAAYDEARSWVEECSDPTGTKEEVFSNGDARQLSVDGATGVFRGWGYGAVEFCPEACDAGWFPQQGVALLGDRLVLVELIELGGPDRPAGQAAEMEQLFTAAVDRAAGRAPTIDPLP